MIGGEQPSATLRRLINGYQVSQAIHVAAELGIADLLAGGPRDADDLTEATQTDGDSLYRLLRALASVGVLHEEDGRRFSLTPVGDALRSDAPAGLGGWAAFVGSPYIWLAWSALLHSVQTGENAFRHVHGTDVWTHRAQRPEESARFDRAMTALTRLGNRSLIDAYDFGRFETIVDVGGGRGALLEALLERYGSMRGVLFDQPHVVDGVELGDRGRVVAGSFFDGVPEGGDAYILKAIVHDWEDEDAARILRNCRRADAAVLVIERIVGGANEDPLTKFTDLTMLVGPGGRERTLDEFAALFERSGLELRSATRSDAGLNVIEGIPR